MECLMLQWKIVTDADCSRINPAIYALRHRSTSEHRIIRSVRTLVSRSRIQVPICVNKLALDISMERYLLQARFKIPDRLLCVTGEFQCQTFDFRSELERFNNKDYCSSPVTVPSIYFLNGTDTGLVCSSDPSYISYQWYWMVLLFRCNGFSFASRPGLSHAPLFCFRNHDKWLHDWNRSYLRRRNTFS